MNTIFNGKLYQASQIPLVSPFLFSFQFSQGVFETLRTYNGENVEILYLEEHLDRLIESTSILKIKTPKALKNTLQKNCQELLQKTVRARSCAYPIGNFRLKIFYSPDFYWITINLLPDFPEENYKKGVKITDTIFERNFPKAKYPNPAYKIFSESQPEDCFETIFFNEQGYLREGNISNVFAVFKGVLHTPEKNILPGITRKITLEIARSLNIPVILGEISRGKLQTADEIFLTNTTKEMLPVKEWGTWKNKSFVIAHQLRAALHQSLEHR